MVNKKSKLSYIILAATLVVIVAATTLTLWLTGAWFTAQKSDNGNLTTATISVQAKQDGNVVTANETKTLTSSQLITSSNKFTIKNTSNINVYVRARIVCNWDEDYQGYERTYEVLNYTLGSNWNAVSGSSANDKITNNNFIYYNAALTPNQEVDILTAVSIKSGKSMPDDAKLSIFVEAVQADNVGKNAFINSDSELTSSNWSSVIA